MCAPLGKRIMSQQELVRGERTFAYESNGVYCTEEKKKVVIQCHFSIFDFSGRIFVMWV